MKGHRTLNIRTFRGMAAAFISLRQNQLMTFNSTSALVNPQIAWLRFRHVIPNTITFSSATATTNSVRRWPKEARTVWSAAGKHVVERSNEYNEDASSWAKTAWTVRSDNTTRGSSEHSDDGGSREITKYPRPQEVPWQKELANRVHLIGVIGQHVQFKRMRSGKAYAQTSLRVRSGRYRETMWITLVFWSELAEIAAQHLKQYDRVYISGFFGLEKTAGEDAKLHRYKVIVMTLNFIRKTSPDFSQQAVVDKNTPSVHLFKQAGKNAQEDAAFIESLWQEYFASPLGWWDNRTKKMNPRSPDFKHKDTGEVLWINGRFTPSWVKSQLAVLDSRMKVLEEWGKGGSSERYQGSLSSAQDSGF